MHVFAASLGAYCTARCHSVEQETDSTCLAFLLGVLCSVGDRIVKINGTSVEDLTHQETVDVIKSTGKRVKILTEPALAPLADDALASDSEA